MFLFTISIVVVPIDIMDVLSADYRPLIWRACPCENICGSRPFWAAAGITREAARHRAGGGTDGQGATVAALLPSRCFRPEKVDFRYRSAAPAEAVRRPLPHIHDQCGSEASKTGSAVAAHARIDDAERAGLDQPFG